MRKLFIGALLLAGLAAFAGTCTLQHYQLTKIGTHDTYAGEIHNDTGANFLQHNIVVAFTDSDGTVVETKTITPVPALAAGRRVQLLLDRQLRGRSDYEHRPGAAGVRHVAQGW